MIYFRFLAYSKSYCFILFVSFKSFTLKRKFHLSDLESRDPQVSLNLCDWISVSDESLHLLFEIFGPISRLWLKHQPRPWGQGWVLIQRSLASKGPCHGYFTSFNRELKQRQRRRQRKRQQAIGLDWQNNNFARRASLFFVHFFPSLHNYDVKKPIFRIYGGLQHKTTTAFFFFSWPSRIHAAPEKIANIWRIERGGISAIKFEAARLDDNWLRFS